MKWQEKGSGQEQFVKQKPHSNVKLNPVETFHTVCHYRHIVVRSTIVPTAARRIVVNEMTKFITPVFIVIIGKRISYDVSINSFKKLRQKKNV